MNYSTPTKINQPTYSEFQLIKALDDWIFQSYGISQPVHQRIIRYWARRINNNPKMKRQIRQGEMLRQGGGRMPTFGQAVRFTNLPTETQPDRRVGDVFFLHDQAETNRNRG